MEHRVSIEAGALAVLASASERFLRFAQDLHDAGCQEVMQDDLDTLKEAIQTGRLALGKEQSQER